MATHASPRGDVAVLVPAAGSGTRLGPGEPKALRVLAGVPLLVHAVRRLGRASSVGCIVVAAPPGETEQLRSIIAPELPPHLDLAVVDGGDTRQASVARTLAAAPTDYSIILVHDAARALAPPELVERVAAAVRAGHDAVIPVMPVSDTVKEVDGSGYVIGTVDRSVLRVVQTPQGFRRSVLEAAHQHPPGDLTDDAGLVERLGVRVLCVPGDEAAIKITRPADLILAEALLAVSAAA